MRRGIEGRGWAFPISELGEFEQQEGARDWTRGPEARDDCKPYDMSDVGGRKGSGSPRRDMRLMMTERVKKARFACSRVKGNVDCFGQQRITYGSGIPACDLGLLLDSRDRPSMWQEATMIVCHRLAWSSQLDDLASRVLATYVLRDTSSQEVGTDARRK